MSNTLFNDASLNVKVNIPSGGVQDNEFNTTNVVTITTSGGVGGGGSIQNLADVDDDPLVNNGILIYNSANSTYTLTQIPNGAFFEFEFTAANGQTNFAGNDNNSASLNYRTADSIKVFLNGVLLENTTDYTATNGANVVLTSGASNNDILQIHSYNIFSSNNISVASNNNIGLSNSNPSHMLSVNGNTFLQQNTVINDTLLDANNRALKVYYANGSVAWG